MTYGIDSGSMVAAEVAEHSLHSKPRAKRLGPRMRSRGRNCRPEGVTRIPGADGDHRP